MKLNIKALALASAILWALALLLTGVLNLIWPGYGGAFLKIMDSLYPGFKADGTMGDLIVGVLYALVDGAVCGLVFGWLYNLLCGRSAGRS